MAIEVSMKDVNKYILYKQHLSQSTKVDDISKICSDIYGLHATNQTTPYLSLFARMNEFSKEYLDQEAYEKKNLGKIRCMRKTVFILPKQLIPLTYSATKQLYAKRFGDYLKNLGLRSDDYKEYAQEIAHILKNRVLSTTEIKKEMKDKKHASAIISLMGDKLELIRNKPVKSWRDKRHTYSLFPEYFPNLSVELDEYESMKKLIEQYILCYGPVTETDIVWWTGFNKKPVRKILKEVEEKITEIRIEEIEHNYVMYKDDLSKLQSNQIDEKNTINLLPDLDPYLMGYKNRERYVQQEYYNLVYDRSGNATPTILIDGQVKGVWDFISAKKPLIKIHLLEKMPEDIEQIIIKKTEEIGEFIFDEEVSIKICENMEPLNTRTPGEVMTPLKHCV